MTNRGAEPPTGTGVRLAVDVPGGVRRLTELRPGRWVVVGGLAVLVATAYVSASALDSDGSADVIALARLVALDVAHLRWQFGAVVLALAGLHYIASAAAARAAAGVTLPVGELLMVQLAAAAANRVTPGGVGGSALTTRYLTRKGLSLPSALAAVGVLVLLGGLADLLVLLALVSVGRWFALPVGPAAFVAYVRHATSALGPGRSPWLWAAVAAVLGLTAWIVAIRHGDRLRRFARDLVGPVGSIARCPRRLLALLAASGSTTLVLAFAFAATTAMVPGPHPRAGLGLLVVAFMLGSAAGSAVPIPAGLGSTEAALAAVLIGLQVPASHAVQVVLIFRIVTFWTPAVLGVLVARRLHRQGAL